MSLNGDLASREIISETEEIVIIIIFKFCPTLRREIILQTMYTNLATPFDATHDNHYNQRNESIYDAAIPTPINPLQVQPNQISGNRLGLPLPQQAAVLTTKN